MEAAAYKRIHRLKLVDVTAHNIPGDDSPDQLDHAVHDAAHAVDRNHGVGIVPGLELASPAP